MKATIYDKKGKEVEKIDLPKDIFEVAWNADLVHQTVTSMLSSARSNTAHTKDRSEVSGGGKKPWKQKGTGRARHGSTRSPIWRSGGITFGPRNDRNYDRKVNKKAKAKALAVVLSQKLRDNELIFVDSLKLDDIKTKQAAGIVSAIATNKDYSDFESKKNNCAVVALSERDENTEKSFRNISNLKLDLINNVNIMDLLNHKYLLIENPKVSFEVLANRVKASAKVEESAKETPAKKEDK